MTKLGIELSHFGALWRHILSICGVLTTLWLFSGPLVKAYAADAFVEMLEAQGMSPKDFAAIKSKTNEIATDNEKIKSDLNSVKQQNGAISAKQDALQTQSSRIERQLDQVLQVLIGRPPQ
jgi:septal ring factor EnvC (AmiA/AmiB activator)